MGDRALPFKLIEQIQSYINLVDDSRFYVQDENSTPCK